MCEVDAALMISVGSRDGLFHVVDSFMMLGYLLLAATLILFLFYTYQHLRRFYGKLKETRRR